MTIPFQRNGRPTAAGMRATAQAVNEQGPSRRRTTSANGPDTFLWIYEDRARALALIRGRAVLEVLKLANLENIARWSLSGRGWVVPTERLADLCAMADYNNTPYRVRGVDDAAHS